MALVDDTDAAGTWFVVAQENIVLHGVKITMAQYHRALAFYKEIVAYDVAARFNGNDLCLPVAVFKVIGHDAGVAIELAMLRYAYPYHFAGIGGKWYALSKIIVVYGVLVFPASFIIQQYGQQYAHVGFTLEG